jgi:hypothetical protein
MMTIVIRGKVYFVGEEDLIKYLEARLRGKRPDPVEYFGPDLSQTETDIGKLKRAEIVQWIEYLEQGIAQDNAGRAPECKRIIG